MLKFTLEENWEILKTFFQSGESSTKTARKLRSKFGKNKAPSRQFVDSFVKRVRETGSLMDKTTRLRARPVRSVENIPAVAESVNDNPSTSTRHRAQKWDISRTSLQRILTKDLRLRPYKIQLVQQPKPHDYPLRFRFAERAQERLVEDDHFYRKIVFSDEAHFHLCGLLISKTVAFGVKKIHKSTWRSQCIHNE